MLGLLLILGGLLLLIGKDKRSSDLIVDFKDFPVSVKLLMVVMFFGSIYLLAISQYQNIFTSLDMFLNYLDANGIVICCLFISAIILIENLFHRSIAYISNPNVRLFVYGIVSIVYIIVLVIR